MWLNKDAVTQAFHSSLFLFSQLMLCLGSPNTISESILTQSSLLCKRFCETQPDFFLFLPSPEIESLLSKSQKLGRQTELFLVHPSDGWENHLHLPIWLGQAAFRPAWLENIKNAISRDLAGLTYRSRIHHLSSKRGVSVVMIVRYHSTDWQAGVSSATEQVCPQFASSSRIWLFPTSRGLSP